MKRERVSCIIPAHNEAQRIGSVLSAVYNHPLIDEVLVVQNFSTDGTSEAVKSFIKKNNARKIKLLEDNNHPGKAYAMYLGVKKSKYQLLLFLDADLKGLNKKNINKLLLPVTNNQSDLTISLMRDALPLFKLFKVNPICGQRTVRKSLFLEMPDCKFSSYGIESLQNKFLINSGKIIQIVKMPNVTQSVKYKKIGFFRGWYEEMKAIRIIFRAVSFFEFVRILFFLSRNAVKD